MGHGIKGSRNRGIQESSVVMEEKVEESVVLGSWNGFCEECYW